MRKVTEDSVEAFLSSTNVTLGNTKTMVKEGVTYLYLHGNAIAKRGKNGTIYISACGWLTNTTKCRLNGIPGVYICQKNKIWYLNGQKWSGETIAIPKK